MSEAPEKAAVPSLDLEEMERIALALFKARWPGKAWDGPTINRSYWRRKARALNQGGEHG
jgi:hypothetical protein